MNALRSNLSERVVGRLLSQRDVAFLVVIAVVVAAVFTLTTNTTRKEIGRAHV